MANLKRIWKKTWHFIWEDNSIWSWIVNIVLAYVLIKFIVYPVLGLILTTSHPIVAVVSSSMEHDTAFDSWWQEQEKFYQDFNISKEDFLTYKFKNGFNKGDIMILKGTKPENIQIGNIIVFDAGASDPIIHRVIKKWQEEDNYHFQTKGDHNPATYNFESRITESRYIGQAVVRVPLLGWVKIGFVELLKFLKVV